MKAGNAPGAQPDATWGQAIDLSTHGFWPDGKSLFFSLGGDIWWVDSEVIAALDREDAAPSIRSIGTVGTVAADMSRLSSESL